MELHARGSVIDGKYTIVAKLREGGMGAIYKVHHNLLDEVRVIKVMRAQAAEQDEMRRRFSQEAKIVTRLKHPNIASVYDFAIDDDGTAYIVMEYVDGVNLAEVAKAVGTVPVAFVLEVARQALDALAYLHRKNIAHRDISPDNIMCTDEDGQVVVKLVDLGIAKDLQSTGTQTKTGLFLGKLKYASPEQLGMMDDGQAIDGRSDLYSLAVVMYQLLTTQMPIAGETAQALIAGHLFHAPMSFQRSDPDGLIPEDLRAVILRALEKKREVRWASAEEFQNAIENLQQNLPAANATDLRALLQRARTAVPAAEPDITPSAQERVARQFSPNETTAETIHLASGPTMVETVVANTPVTEPKSLPRKHSRWLFVAVPAIAVAAAFGGFLVAPRRDAVPATPKPAPRQQVAQKQAANPPVAVPQQHVDGPQLVHNTTGDVLEKVIHSEGPKPVEVRPKSTPVRMAEKPKPSEPPRDERPMLPVQTNPTPVPPPVVVTNSAPPAAPAKIVAPGPSDEDQVRQTVAEFVRAQESLDPALYARIFPSAPLRRVTDSFSQLRSQTLSLAIDDVEVSGRRATVHAAETRSIVPKAGAEQHLARKTTIVLEKSGDGWVVSGLR